LIYLLPMHCCGRLHSLDLDLDGDFLPYACLPAFGGGPLGRRFGRGLTGVCGTVVAGFIHWPVARGTRTIRVSFIMGRSGCVSYPRSVEGQMYKCMAAWREGRGRGGGKKARRGKGICCNIECHADISLQIRSHSKSHLHHK
jgi:hypothetical protein